MRIFIANCCFAWLLFSMQSYAQAPVMPRDEQTQLFSYSKVVEIAGVSKTDLYNRALGWATKYYKNPADVIREKDQATGKMVCKARFKLMGQPDKKGFQDDDGNVQYTLIIEAKEGRYRYQLTDINWKQQSYFAAERWLDTKAQQYSPEWNFYLQETDQNVQSIISNLEKAMAEMPKVKKDEW